MPTCSDLGYSKKDILLFKYNGTPTASNAFLVTGEINPSITNAEEELDLVGNGEMNNSRKIYDDKNTQADIEVAMVVEGTGSPGTAPRIADFYKAAGFTETIDADNNKVIYTPHFDCINPSAAIVYKGGKQKTVYDGIVAGMTISGTIGTSIKISFPLAGYTDQVKTNEAVTIPDISFNDPFIMDYATVVTIGGTEVSAESFELAYNADIGRYYFTNFRLAGRTDANPTMSVTAIKNFNDASAWTDFLNRTAKEIVITGHNVDGEKFTVKAFRAIPLPVEDGDSNGVLTETRKYDLKKDATTGLTLEIVYE